MIRFSSFPLDRKINLLKFYFDRNRQCCQGNKFIVCAHYEKINQHERHQQDADCKPDSVVKNHLSGPGVAAQTNRRLWRIQFVRPPLGTGGIQQLTQGLRPGKPQAPSV